VREQLIDIDTLVNLLDDGNCQESKNEEAAGQSWYGQQVLVGKEVIIAIGPYMMAIWEEESQWQF